MNIRLSHRSTIRVMVTRPVEPRRTSQGMTHPAGNAVLTDETLQAAYPDFTYISHQPVAGEPAPGLETGREYLLSGSWHSEQCFHFHAAELIE